ncbi:hypothetical protein SprV_0802611400 [Sparganum proliferum]
MRRYKDTLKSSLKRLQINPTNWEELALDRPTWRRTVKTGAAIYEANRIAAAKVKREARKSQVRPVRKRRRTTASNVSSVSTDIPGSNWAFWTPSDQLRLSDFINHRRPARLFLVLSAAH